MKQFYFFTIDQFSLIKQIKYKRTWYWPLSTIKNIFKELRLLSIVWVIFLSYSKYNYKIIN